MDQKWHRKAIEGALLMFIDLSEVTPHAVLCASRMVSPGASSPPRAIAARRLNTLERLRRIN